MNNEKEAIDTALGETKNIKIKQEIPDMDEVDSAGDTNNNIGIEQQIPDAAAERHSSHGSEYTLKPPPLPSRVREA